LFHPNYSIKFPWATDNVATNPCFWFENLLETESCTGNLEDCHWAQRLTDQQKTLVKQFRKYQEKLINLKTFQETSQAEGIHRCYVFNNLVETGTCNGIATCSWYDELSGEQQLRVIRAYDPLSRVDYDKYHFGRADTPQPESEPTTPTEQHPVSIEIDSPVLSRTIDPALEQLAEQFEQTRIQQLPGHLDTGADEEMATQQMQALLESMNKLLASSNDGVRAPKAFKGDLKDAERFMQACEVYFGQKDAQYKGKVEKQIMYALTSCEDKAGTWATPIIAEFLDNGAADPYTTWKDFKTDFLASFGSPNPGADARQALESITQGNKSVAEYTAEFALLAGRSKLSQVDLRGKYIRGLQDRVKEKLASLDDIDTYDKVKKAALNIEINMRDMGMWKSRTTTTTSWTPHWKARAADPNAMQVDATNVRATPGIIPIASRGRIQPKEWMRTLTCHGCGKMGHVHAICDNNPKRREWEERPRPQMGRTTGAPRASIRATQVDMEPSARVEEVKEENNWEERCHALEKQMAELVGFLEKNQDF
jgi:hypothetical protein